MTALSTSETREPLPLQIQDLTADHLPDIEKIESASFRDPWPVSAFRNLIIQTKTNWAAIHENEVAGYLVTQWVLDEIHILNLAVAKKYQRRGVGSALLGFLLNRGQENGMRDAFLEVRVSNEPAQILYERHGFSKLNIRSRYYPDGEDALILHKRIQRAQDVPDSGKKSSPEKED